MNRDTSLRVTTCTYVTLQLLCEPSQFFITDRDFLKASFWINFQAEFWGLIWCETAACDVLEYELFVIRVFHSEFRSDKSTIRVWFTSHKVAGWEGERALIILKIDVLNKIRIELSCIFYLATWITQVYFHNRSIELVRTLDTLYSFAESSSCILICRIHLHNCLLHNLCVHVKHDQANYETNRSNSDCCNG